MKDYKLVFLTAKAKTSKADKPYIEYNLVLEVPYDEKTTRNLSMFTISAKDIVDFANKAIELDPKFITATKAKNKDGKEVTYFNYDLSAAKEKDEATKPSEAATWPAK